MTKTQALRLYLMPAQERQKRMESEMQTGGKTVGGHDWKSGLPARADFVSGMMSAHGKTAEHWGEIWDRMDASKRAKANG